MLHFVTMKYFLNSNSGTERKKSSSDSSLSKEVKKKKKKVQKDYTNTIEVPQLDLTPASPEKIGPRPTTNLLGNRLAKSKLRCGRIMNMSNYDHKLHNIHRVFSCFNSYRVSNIGG